MASKSKEQTDTIERVMHEFKHGELAQGGKVENPKQAVAIALREARASKYEAPRKNKENLRKTKARERRGETAQARDEGAGGRKSGASGGSRASLYEEARRQNISGRSTMSKDELARALRR